MQHFDDPISTGERREAVGRRIYILVPSLERGSGGVTTSMTTLANGLAERHDVEMINLFRHPGPLRLPLDPRIRVSYVSDERHPVAVRGLENRPSRLINGKLPTSALTDELLRRKLSSLRAGVLITNKPVLHQAAAMWAPEKVRVVAVEHATAQQRGRAIRRMYRRHAKNIDAFVTVNEFDLASYGLLLSPDTRVAAIPNAVPEIEVTQSALDRPVVVAAGSLIERKGFDRLIEAFAPLVPDHPEWCLHIYGKGRERARLVRLIRALGMQGHVELKGYDDRLHLRLAEASIYAMSSRHESFGLVIVEAMAAGLPVVAFDCPNGPRSIVTHESDGLLVPDGDQAEFTAALRRLMDDEVLRHRMSRSGRHAVTRYDVDRVVRQWERLFDEVSGDVVPALTVPAPGRVAG